MKITLILLLAFTESSTSSSYIISEMFRNAKSVRLRNASINSLNEPFQKRYMLSFSFNLPAQFEHLAQRWKASKKMTMLNCKVKSSRKLLELMRNRDV